MSARPDTRAAASEARIASQKVPSGEAHWAAKARAGAIVRLRQMGLAQRRDEYWRFTDPDGLAAAAQAETALPADIPGALRVDLATSHWTTPEGIELAPLSTVLTRDIHWAADLFGTIEAAAHVPVPRPFACLTTAFATAGAVMRVSGAGGTLHLDHSALAEGTLVHSLLRLEADSSLTLIESGTPVPGGISTLETDIGEGAVLHHIRLQDGVANGAAHVFARIGAQGEYRAFTLGAQGSVIRNETVLTLNGRAGKAHVAGVWIGAGTTHHDDTIFITHAAPNCESRQVFRSVLGRGAVTAFQGKILVKQIAQKTDGYQLSQALLLDDEAQFLGKPELEIYADDVKCSHGSTTGAIDETALFYLRSRGVPESQARHLLVLAFLNATLDEVADDRLREMLATRVAVLAGRVLG